jgi:hypothetical protein
MREVVMKYLFIFLFAAALLTVVVSVMLMNLVLAEVQIFLGRHRISNQ